MNVLDIAFLTSISNFYVCRFKEELHSTFQCPYKSPILENIGNIGKLGLISASLSVVKIFSKTTASSTTSTFKLIYFGNLVLNHSQRGSRNNEHVPILHLRNLKTGNQADMKTRRHYFKAT